MDRQKIFLLFGAAWLSAALLTWFVYAKTTAPKAEKKITIMAAVRDLPVGARVKKTDLKQVSVLEKDLPTGAALKDADALDRVALYPVAANEPLTDSKLSKTTGSEGVSATIDDGMRAVSVQITDTSGVAGLIQPNSRVDVTFTRPGSMAEAISSTILQDVKVLAVGRLTQAGQTLDPKAPKVPVVTLVVTPEDATKLELAKNQGKISLSLRNPLDRSTNDNASPVTTEILDPMISARLARARRGRTTTVTGQIPNLDDPRVWQELTGEKKVRDEEKEKAKLAEEEAKRKLAEKPKYVVDVFRGEKHTQEKFND